MKYYGYKPLGITSSQIPNMPQLFIEGDNGNLYLTAAAWQYIYKSTDKGENWSIVVNHPGWGIMSFWHDRANDYLYFVEFDDNPDDLRIWYLDMSDDNVYQVGLNITPTGGWFMRPDDIDVFLYGGNVYCMINYTTPTATVYTKFYKYVSSWSEVATESIYQGTGSVVIVGNIAYYLNGGSGGDVVLRKYNLSTDTWNSPHTVDTGFILPGLDGITYDGDDILLFLISEEVVSDRYVYKYSISDDSSSKITLLTVYLMLDRDTQAGIFEKGFEFSYTGRNIYQISRSITPLGKITSLEDIITGYITGITDNLLITDLGEMFEYVDISNELKEVIIETKLGEISTAEIVTDLNITTGQTINFYDDSDNITFMGQAYKRDSKDGKEFIYKCVGYDKEISSRKYTGSFSSKTAKEIMEYILDGDLDGNGTAEEASTSFLYYNSLIDNDASFTITYTISFKNKTIKEVFDTLMDLEDGIWGVNPDGEVYAYALVDIPSTGEVITQSTGEIYAEPPKISQMMWEINKISLYGAIVDGVRLQNEPGYGEDISSQQQNGIIEFIDHYPHINDQTTLNNLADAVLVRTGLTTNPIYIDVNFKGIGYKQVGKTLNFQFIPYTDLASAIDYYILSQIYSAKQDVGTYILSSGLIQEGREHEVGIQKTSDADEEQIDNVAIAVNTNAIAVAAKQGILPIGFIGMFQGTWVDDETMPGWFKCDGENGTVDLVDKFVRGAATSGGSGGSNDAIAVTHSHNHGHNHTHGTSGSHRHPTLQRNSDWSFVTGSNITPIRTTSEAYLKTAYEGGHLHTADNTLDNTSAGVSGTNKNIPAYWALIFIQRIS